MDGYLKIGTEIDTKSFDAQIDYIEAQLLEIEDKLKKADMGFEVGDTMKLEAQYEKLIQQLGKLKKKQEDFNKTNLTKIQNAIENVGKSTSKTISKVSKWALAIFGVRSAYNFVRQSASTLAQYNEQIASDLEYIRFALASSLQPIIENMISLIYKLLTYINSISIAWFGVNLFANASADALNKSNKSAKELKKTLSSFDEMNVIGDTSGSQTTAPSVDLSGAILSEEQLKIPNWLNLLTSGLVGVAVAMTAVKFGMEGIKAVGLGLVITGVIMAIQNLFEYIKNPTWDSFGGIIQGLGIAVAGLGVLFLGLPGIIAGVVLAITGLLVSNKDKIQELWGNLKNWIFEKFINPIEEKFGVFGKMITAPVKGAIETIESYFRNSLKFARDILDGIIMIFKGDFKNGLLQVGKGIVNQIITYINFMINAINTFFSPFRQIIVSVGNALGKNWNMSNIKIPTIQYLATGGIINNPGRGVPIGGAFGGEAGAEGVIPLTDSQAMETLGQAIGRYITINANITNSMNGRVISRELQKINNNNDFAYNR